MERDEDIFAPESLAALDAALEEVARELDGDDPPSDAAQPEPPDGERAGKRPEHERARPQPDSERAAAHAQSELSRSTPTRRDRHPDDAPDGAPLPLTAKTTLVRGGKTLVSPLSTPDDDDDDRSPSLADDEAPVRGDVGADATAAEASPATTLPATRDERGAARQPLAEEPAALTDDEADVRRGKSRKKLRSAASDPPPTETSTSPHHGDAPSAPPTARSLAPTEPERSTRSTPSERAAASRASSPPRGATARAAREHIRTQPSPTLVEADADAPWRSRSNPAPRPVEPDGAPRIGAAHVAAVLAALVLGFIVGRASAPDRDGPPTPEIGPRSTLEPRATAPRAPGSPAPAAAPAPPDPHLPTDPAPVASVAPTGPEASAAAQPKGVWPSPTGDGDAPPAPRPPTTSPQPTPPPPPRMPPAPPSPAPKIPDKAFVPDDI